MDPILKHYGLHGDSMRSSRSGTSEEDLLLLFMLYARDDGVFRGNPFYGTAYTDILSYYGE